VLAIRKDGQLIGLAPAYIECFSERRILPLGISVSDHLDVLADLDYVQPNVAALASAAQAHGLDLFLPVME
jgi:hypothetical protein